MVFSLLKNTSRQRFHKKRITLLGCPKLDAVNYAEKLAEMFLHNSIKSITVIRMTVPSCGGLPIAVKMRWK